MMERRVALVIGQHGTELVVKVSSLFTLFNLPHDITPPLALHALMRVGFLHLIERARSELAGRLRAGGLPAILVPDSL